MSRQPPDPDLWVRYLDWSAAQINKRVLELSPDEMWQLASRVSDEDTPAAVVDSASHYLDLVRRITLHVARALDLPSYEEWVAEYRRDPQPYDREMMGVDLAQPG